MKKLAILAVLLFACSPSFADEGTGTAMIQFGQQNGIPMDRIDNLSGTTIYALNGVSNGFVPTVVFLWNLKAPLEEGDSFCWESWQTMPDFTTIHYFYAGNVRVVYGGFGTYYHVDYEWHSDIIPD